MSATRSSLSSPYSHSTVTLASPLVEEALTRVTPEMPLMPWLSGFETSLATISGEAPGYEAVRTAVGTWVDGNNSWRSENAAITPKMTMATVTIPTMSRLAKLSLVSVVMSVSPLCAHRVP